MNDAHFVAPSSHKICVIDKGHIIEEGPHAELVLKKDGKYAELSKLAGMTGGDAKALSKAIAKAKLELKRDPENNVLQEVGAQCN